MTTGDKIALVAAVAAVVSAAIALAAFFVVLVVRKDSKASAEAAHKSAAEAQRANGLAAQQLEMASGELKRQIQKDIKDGQPCFTWDGISSAVRSVTYKLKNRGGTISNIAVTSENGFEASISPRDLIAQDAEAEVRFSCNVQPQPNSFKFSIEADDKFNQRRIINFTIAWRGGRDWELPELAQN